jgi:hypothetical protein
VIGKRRSFASELSGAVVLGLLLGQGALKAAPGMPLLVAPASNAVTVGTSPTLTVGVSDPASNNLSVKFYGRVAAPGSNFTIVALPDTQYYVSSKNGGVPGMFYAQADWIRTNALLRNIAFVAQLGDCVEYGDTNNGPSNLAEWRNATNALYRLEPPLGNLYPQGIPYAVAVGNHDQSPNGASDGTTTFYNQYFGAPHFNGRAYYGGHYGSDNDNHFELFSAGGLEFIAVFLEYDTAADPLVLDWADTLLQTYPNRRAIVVSHYIGRPTTPSTFGPQGLAIYDALKGNPNLFLMLSGHVDGEGSRQDNFNGRIVNTLVSDFQFRTNGGSGWMRIMEFSPSNSLIHVSTYSPYFKQFETDADSEFTLPYTMQQPGTSFVPIATNINVASGSSNSCVWTGLVAGTVYEWYVTVSNGSETTTGAVWRFTTGLSALPTNTPPSISAFSHQIIQANSSTTNIAFTISDRETDPTNLTVKVHSAHGTLLTAAGVSLGGTGTNRALKLTPAPDQAGATWITVIVSDGNMSASNSFMLKVLRSRTITLWDFNSNPPDNNTSTGTLAPAVGSGTASSVGTATNSLNSNVAPLSFDPHASDNSKWRFGNFPVQGTASGTSGAQFRLSTEGYQNIAVSWDHYNSATGSRYWRLQYTLDGINYVNFTRYTNPVEVTWFPTGANLSGIPGANNNSNFGIRLVSEWENDLTALYKGTQASGGYSINGTLWLDMVTFSGDYLPLTLTVTRKDAGVELSWLTNFAGVILQSRGALTAGSWNSFPQTPNLAGDHYVVTISNALGNQFFRLARP